MQCRLPKIYKIKPLPEIGTALNDMSWADIRRISDAGLASSYFKVGDRKLVTLNGTVGNLSLSNVTTYAFIIGFDHNSSVEGSGRIHFQFGKTALSGGTDICFVDSVYGHTGSTAAFRMKTTNTNSGGWSSSYMRGTVCAAFKNALPSALQSAIKTVTKYTDNTGNSSEASAVTATTDTIFILSEYEVFGSITYGNSNESSKQAQYDYYSAGNSKFKYNHSATTDAVFWWLRSPSASYSNYFVGVNTRGTAGNGSTNDSRGFAPCFCV